METEKELKTLEDEVQEAVLAALCELADDIDLPLHKIQPPASILVAAAKAATQVFMAFERGYRMNE